MSFFRDTTLLFFKDRYRPMKYFKHILILCIIICALAFSAITAVPVYADNESRSVHLKSEDIEFSLSVTDCSDGKNNGKITCTIEDTGNSDVYFISFNAGKKYRKMSGTKFTLKELKAGSYSVRVMKNNDNASASDICTVYVGDSSDSRSIDIHTVSCGEKIYKDGKIKIYIDNYKDDSDREYEYTANDGKTWRPMKSKSITVTNLKSGSRKIAVRDKNDTSYCSTEITVKVPEAEAGTSRYIKVDNILQLPELPTGCEITSLTMLLNHIGFKADKRNLADNYLPMGEYRASDFKKVFVGNPHSTYAYGCLSEAIVEAAEKYLEKYDKNSEWKVKNITGCTAESLYAAIDSGNPVIVWATADMAEPQEGYKWTVAETGKEVTWTRYEHCLLLTGYNKEKQVVYMNDPMSGRKKYDMKLFEKRFRQMGSNAVIIEKK